MIGELLDKISRYNIVNYLLPGTLFSVLGEAVSSYSLVQENVLVGLFLYYFIGLSISRIGSLIVEPAFKRFNFVEFAKYEDFLAAIKSDDKLELLSEENNVYRTIVALLVTIGLLWLFEVAASNYPPLRDIAVPALALMLLLIFSFAYQKQTRYISKRVDSAKQ